MELETLEELKRQRELKEAKKHEEEKPQKENMPKAVNPKHTVPYGNGSQEEQDEMEHLKKTNPALYAAITSWN